MNESRFRGRELLAADTLRVAELIESRLVDNNSGLFVVFEDREVIWATKPNREPFYLARHDFNRDGPDAGTPPEVVEHLNDSIWKHFIWIPIFVVQGDVNRFAVRYAHELQHYRQVFERESQVLGSESLRQVETFLSQLWSEGFKPTIKIEKDPKELDAEIVAIDTFELVLGPSSFEPFVESEAPEMREFYRRVLELRGQIKQRCT